MGIRLFFWALLIESVQGNGVWKREGGIKEGEDKKSHDFQQNFYAKVVRTWEGSSNSLHYLVSFILLLDKL